MKKLIVFLLCIIIVIPAYAMRIGKEVALKKPIDEQVTKLDLILEKIIKVLQGRVSYGTVTDGSRGENIWGQFQVVSDTGAADTEFTVAHTLGYTPTGFILVSIDKGAVVYQSGTAWTSTNTYFKCSVANCDVSVFLF